ELKYIKQKEYQRQEEKIVQAKAEEAKEQLLKYKAAEELKNKDKLKKWGLVFVGSECVKVLEVDSV
ncbi:MAG: PD-(D/E)XK nuclease domain-containing protein, partial [Bacillota bacterium]